MSELYNFEYYHSGCGPIPYEEPEHWNEFFGQFADRIIADFHPHTVLDAGCAMGYLVAALRDRGVEAYGIDISEYAISMVREDVRQYCFVHSLTDPMPEGLPEHFDLVTNIEVMEHLYAEDGQKAIENLCAVTNCVIFCSTPSDFTEKTHVNVQQREYWAKLFAANGFFDDINYRPTYLVPYASCFRRGTDWIRQVEDYERNIRMSEDAFAKALEDKERHIQDQNHIIEEKDRHIQNQNLIIEEKDRHIQNQSETLEEKERCIQDQKEIIEDKEYQIQECSNQLNKTLQRQDEMEKDAEDRERAARMLLEQRSAEWEQEADKLQTQIGEQDRKLSEQGTRYKEQSEKFAEQSAELAHYKEHYLAAISQREELKRQLAATQAAYADIANAEWWKITKPMRMVLDAIKRGLHANRYTLLICKGFHSLREYGIRITWQRVKERFRRHKSKPELTGAQDTKEELDAQRSRRFSRRVKISIVVPLYNTPKEFLEEMICSVQAQTFSNWELCMADGSDKQHDYVAELCKQYARTDKRIRYKKLAENKGISENTNACIDMVTGAYIGLLDHDDLLHPAALYNVMQAIREQNADMVYTDENTFHKSPADAYTPHFKPDFAPDTLRSYNYICHFTVFRRTLLDALGEAFRPAFDGSQDYDLILRLTEKAKHIVHIPKILYYWRAHPASTALDISTKPYVLAAGRAAVQEHLQRLGLEGTVEDARIPSTYRIRYEIHGEPLISILIPNKDHVDDLQKCVDSIREKSTYSNWEIIIIENNSQEQAAFDYYDALQADERIRVVRWTEAFNFSAIMNFGAKHAKGEHLLLLNNDVEVITPDWLEQLLMFSQRSDVGAVGAMLYYPDDTIQHAGVIVGLGGVAGHAHKYFPRGHFGYMYRLSIIQNYSAVTAACLMTRRDVWNEVGGLDESFAVAFNDVDMCLRLRKAGYLIVWTPYAELYHYESKSRGYEDTPEKQTRFAGEISRFQTRWSKELTAGDPYYNPNLTLDREDFSLK